jgi:hypothetical protein
MATLEFDNGEFTVYTPSETPDKLLYIEDDCQNKEDIITKCTDKTMIVVHNRPYDETTTVVTELKENISEYYFARVGVMNASYASGDTDNIDALFNILVNSDICKNATTIDLISDDSVVLVPGRDRFTSLQTVNYSTGSISNYILNKQDIKKVTTLEDTTWEISTSDFNWTDVYMKTITDDENFSIIFPKDPTKIVFIASDVLDKETIINACNRNTLIIIQKTIQRNSLPTLVGIQTTSITKLAVVSLNTDDDNYRDALFNVVEHLSDTINTIKNIDFLASNIVQSDIWKHYIDNRFAKKAKEITIHASDVLIGKNTWILNCKYPFVPKTVVSETVVSETVVPETVAPEIVAPETVVSETPDKGYDLIGSYFDTSIIEKYNHYLGYDNWWYFKYHFKSVLRKVLIEEEYEMRKTLLELMKNKKQIDIGYIGLLDGLRLDFECYCAKLMLTTDYTKIDEYKTASDEIREIIDKIYSVLGSKDYSGKNIFTINGQTVDSAGTVDLVRIRKPGDSAGKGALAIQGKGEMFPHHGNSVNALLREFDC